MVAYSYSFFYSRILICSISTISFTAIAATLLLADYALASMLGLLLKYGEFGISFSGMEYGLKLGDAFKEVSEGNQTMASLNLMGENFYFVGSMH